MPQKAAQHEYHITTEDGAEYTVLAKDDAQAQKIGEYINSQHASGNTDASTWTDLPDNGFVADKPGKESSVTGATARGLTRGGFFNLNDEISSFGNALIPGMASIDNYFDEGNQQSFLGNPDGFWAAFDNNMKDQASQRAADIAQHPTAERIGEVAGTVAGAGKLGKAVAGIAGRVAPRLAIPAAMRYEAAALAAPVRTAAITGGAIGAGTGAVSGFGAGDTAENRLQSGALGLGAGGVLGAGAGSVIAGLAPTVARYASILMGRGTQQEGVAQVVRALQRDGYDMTSPAAVQALRTELGRYTGKPVSLADIGSATRARAGVGLRSPSAVQQQSIDTVNARAEGQGARLIGDIRANVAPRTDIHALDEQLIEQRAQAALPLREQALFGDGTTAIEAPRAPLALPNPDAPDAGLQRTLGINVPETYSSVPAQPATIVSGRQSRVVDDPQLQQLARLPDAQRALQAAVQRANAERDLRVATGQSIDDLPDISPSADLDMRTFDYLKRFLDDEVNALYKKGDTATFKAGEAKQVQALRDAIRGRLRNVQEDGTVGTEAGPYGQYLDAYSDSSELVDALRAGRGPVPGEPRTGAPGFDQLDPERIAAQQADRSTAAQEFFRVGAARNMVDKVTTARDGSYPANRIVNSDNARQQVEALGIPQSAAQRLFQSVQQERTLNLLPNELRGSQTDARRLASEDADAGLNLRIPFNPGSPTGWMSTALQFVRNKASTARNAGVNEALLPRLLETNPQAIENIISELELSGQAARAAILRRQLSSRKTARTLGAAIGSPVSLQEEQ